MVRDGCPVRACRGGTGGTMPPGEVSPARLGIRRVSLVGGCPGGGGWVNPVLLPVVVVVVGWLVATAQCSVACVGAWAAR